MANRIRPALAIACSLLAASFTSVAQAQFQQSGNTGGLGGVQGGSTGGGLGTTAGGTQSGSGTGGMFGSRSLGSSLSGGSRSMSGGRGVAGATRTADAAGTVTGSERFVRANRQGQFVGSDTTDLRNVFSAMGGQQGRGQQGFGNNRNQNQNPNDGMNDGQGTNRRPVYRTQRVVGFDYHVPAPSTLGTTLGTRINRAVRVEGSKVYVVMAERTAILQGTVPSAHARDLAAQLALLEPGVSNVRNELEVAALAPTGLGPTGLAPTGGQPGVDNPLNANPLKLNPFDSLPSLNPPPEPTAP